MSTIETATALTQQFARGIYAAAHQTEEADVDLTDEGFREVEKLLTSVIAIGVRRELDEREAAQLDAGPEYRTIVFTGDFEEFHRIDDAETRIEELLDAGHPKPTIVNASLDRPGGEVLAMRAQKIITAVAAGSIR